MSIVMSLVGLFFLLFIGFLFSNNKKAINLRTVGGAFLIQAAFGGFVLYVPVGKDILKGVSDAVYSVIDKANDGIRFLFGDLANFKVGFIFVIHVLPVIVFFSSLIAVLYHLGIMQWVIRLLGGALQKALGTSRTESMSATANIFVGQTEAPLVVRPFIPTMTQSELFAIMVGGMASIAGSVMAGYAQMGVPMEYLVAASFMAAPGGLLMAKLMHPETEAPHDDIVALPDDPDKPANVLDAAASGASAGMQLALNVGAMLLAFIGLIALINSIIGGIGGWFGYGNAALATAFEALKTAAAATPELQAAFNSSVQALADQAHVAVTALTITDIDRQLVIEQFSKLQQPELATATKAVVDAAAAKISLEMILGYLFMPLAWMIGVPWKEAMLAGSFIGQKIVVNEFVAYSNFAPYLKDLAEGGKLVAETGMVMTDKTKAIVSFALCGFANLSSIAILLGGLGGMAPNRRHELAKLGMRAVIAGSLANLMSATLAGLFVALS
ncbi:NupC/NupG family nucleoside CNT transporter [Shewanella sp. 4t3-1-2LB]|uniref:NupC/NupG family nucleoside CNT transporter n=1 Tax=Shewanella sp. 4t3-1-2LB TaxID=2817682 RepID=UPI001A9801BE|nr:NupC/NupG family nucleoside CNT transporter [Shewanella sp. 4t3-1-2LB]MBO1271520.1 NupC/NupG family nucleoside CNT transporter [Shewanella sp. 4t3-1-2LB]